jgi:tRNA pseudouridine38-40 synthase
MTRQAPPGDPAAIAPPDPAPSSEVPARGAPELQNLALLLAYDGSLFQGWQVQRHGESVQGRLEEALRVVTRHPARVSGSGRTDAGVHALNQVANVFLPGGLSLRKLQAGLNGLLAPGIAVKAIVPVPPSFHARHRALGKHYRYQIFNRPYPPVFGRQRSWWIKTPLDVAAMQAGARHLLGEHDFSTFRASGCEAPHAVRTLTRLETTRADTPEATLHIDLEANGFLQHMARILTGTLVAVGLGRLAPDDLPAILASRARERADATAPARGLHLIRVRYDLEAFPELRAFAEA